MKKLNKILLVDDDPTTLYINENILKKLAIAQEIILLTNGQLALDYLLTKCGQTPHDWPALVILDHHMPVMDGLELMENLQEKEILKKAEIVFLVLGINTKPQEQEKFKELGVQEFTSKPLSKQTVMAAYTKYWAGDTVEEHTA